VANHDFALIANDYGTVANPAPLLDSDPSPMCDALCADWEVTVFVHVLVVLDEHRCSRYHILLDVNEVLGRNYTPSSNDAVVINFKFYPFNVIASHQKCGIFSDDHRIADLDLARPWSA